MNPSPEAPDLPPPAGPRSPQCVVDAPMAAPEPVEVVSELLLLPDGRILAHHLTPELAALLRGALDSGNPATHPAP